MKVCQGHFFKLLGLGKNKITFFWIYGFFSTKHLFFLFVYKFLNLRINYRNVKLVIMSQQLSQSDSNGIRTHNHLNRKRTLKNLAKLASLANWLSVRLWTKWLWVWILVLSHKLQILGLFWSRSSLTLRLLYSVDSLWNAYVTW